MCVYVCVPENEKRRLLRQRERMISRSSFIPSCRERALQRNRCQSQYEEAPRFGLMSEAWSSTGFPRLCHSRAQIFRFFFFFFFSSYIYLPIYLDSFLCACAVRVILRGQRTSVRVRSFHNYISVSRAGRRIDALSTLFAHFEHKSVSSSVASHRAV